jgi:hypothetical protein
MFKDVYKGWNCTHSSDAHPFDPWILKSEYIGESREVTFSSVADMWLLEVSFLAFTGKGLDGLVAVDLEALLP